MAKVHLDLGEWNLFRVDEKWGPEVELDRIQRLLGEKYDSAAG
jgi:hypothetical protein